ncbi:MAG: DNA-binding response regulator [Gammaproteobacteria bacterium]|nr:DNA-binding response regulator [Gammaproteobacteria bacterium]MBK82145.1 DNA-binding response regulator [Gammaproteobacteria bacterium]|tara:strand:- start:330 stop:1061 length:732 start_codon:yes stop_codon:yes gene_type:complete
MKILIVDDEHLARDRLARMVAQIEDHAVVGQAGNGREALALAQSADPDVVLLDIRMPGMDGLETARHLSELEAPPAVIFCTAYEEHAVQAFDLQAVGYLLKPVRRESLAAALAKAQRVNKAQLAALAEEDGAGARTHISARTRRGIELVPVDDVRYFQADQKYVTVRHGGGEVIVDESLKDLEHEFGDRFLRIHRNCLVATAFIEGLERLGPGQACIRVRDIDEPLDVSRRHLAGVRKFVRNL